MSFSSSLARGPAKSILALSISISISTVAALTAGCGSVAVETGASSGGSGGGGTGGAGLACEAPLADCNADPEDGCEADTQHNGDHCGACDASCDGGACLDGKCSEAPESVAVNQHGVCGMASDGNAVFWVNCTGGQILRKEGPDAVKMVIADTGGWPLEMVLDDDAVLWAAQGHGIKRVPKAGGTVEEVALDEQVWSVAVDSERIYWTSYVPEGDDPGSGGGLYALAKAGGPPVQLWTGSADAIALDDDNVYWSTTPSQQDSTGQIWRMAKSGGPAIQAGVTKGLNSGFFVKGGFLYVLDGRGLVRMPTVDGLEKLEKVDTAYGEVAAIGDELWYQRGGELVRKPIAGGPATPVAWISEGYVAGITAAFGRVYWGNSSQDSIDSLPQ